MSFQTPITIRHALQCMHNHSYRIPAIQRDYVWDANRITWLFDSIMRDYPISSFLFWSVRGENVGEYKFYDFLLNYREVYNCRGQERQSLPNENFTAVLDGQQRLSSLYIGFMGTFAWRVHYGRREDNSETSRPTRRLYLNITRNFEEDEDEDGRIYRFEFLKDLDTRCQTIYEDENNEKWFKVNEILNISLDQLKLYNYVNQFDGNDIAKQNILKLSSTLSKPIINYYLEEDDDLIKALNIFIRINHSAIALKNSDIIMSIAISHWKTDAKKAFEVLISSIREEGYSIENDFILKTFLFLHSRDIKFKATNFKKETALLLEENWSNISESIKAVFKLINVFGYSEHALPSKNALIPIVYYIYHKKIWDTICNQISLKEDRDIIKKWLHNVIIFKIFGSSSDALLTKVRKVFTDNISIPFSRQFESFPSKEIKLSLGAKLSLSDELLEELLHTQKDDVYAFPILSLLFPQLDYKNNNFHKDHLHPRSLVESYDKNLISSDSQEYFDDPYWWNSIINLQMLDSNENQSKSDKTLNEWILSEVKENGKDLGMLRQRCYIPDVDLDISNLKEFLLKRELILREKLKQCLS